MIWSQKKYGLPATPNYAALTGADVFDMTQLRVNVSNSAGNVDLVGQVLSIKSLNNPTKIFSKVDSKGSYNLWLENNKRSFVVANNGAGLFRQASAAQSTTDFGYLWYNAGGYSAMRWTIHCVMRAGCELNYGSFFNLIGCNQGGAGTRPGILIWQMDIPGTGDDRVSVQITKNTAGQINTTGDNNVLPSNEWGVFTVEFNGSLGATSSIKTYWNNTLKTTTNVSSSTAVSPTALDPLEFWGFGGAALTMTTQKFSHLILQNVVESSGVRGTIISELKTWADYFNKDVSYNGQTTKKVVEGRYYQGCRMAQDKVNDNKLFFCFWSGTTANAEAAKRLEITTSNDYGKTWSAFSILVDPAGNEFVISGSCGVNDNNDWVVFYTTAVYTGSPTSGAPSKLYFIKSSNQGGSWSSPVDITSAVPSNGLAAFRVEAQVVVNAGRVMVGLYQLTSEGVTTNSANCIIYSDDNLATFGNKVVRAVGSDYCNESSMLHLGGNNLYHLLGDYTADKWRVYTSSNNGDTWTYQGFALNFTVAAPGTTPSALHKWNLNGTPVASMYYYVHGSFLFYVAYAKVSELLANPLSAWDAQLQLPLINQFMMHNDFRHFNNSIDAVYCSPLQPDVYTGISNTLGQGYVPTRQLQLIRQELGI